MSRIFKPMPTLLVLSGTCVLSGKRIFISAIVSASHPFWPRLRPSHAFSCTCRARPLHTSTSTFACSHNDIKFSRNGAVLQICWSKTLQHREGILLIPLLIIPNSDLWPVTAVHHYFQLVSADANLPFFCVSQGPILQPITFSLFSSFLKETLRNHLSHCLGCHQLFSE